MSDQFKRDILKGEAKYASDKPFEESIKDIKGTVTFNKIHFHGETGTITLSYNDTEIGYLPVQNYTKGDSVTLILAEGLMALTVGYVGEEDEPIKIEHTT